ncbi:MAG: uroporphyrinogen-III C-methyltransferase [Paraclostridium sordellii]
MKGKVYLVGAGPGDYKLMTLKGMECIKKSDVIVYDRLANEKYLKEAKDNCEFIYVGKASSNHALPQDQINEVITKKALEGKIVTRLKGGDPYVFGRGGEEAEFLLDNGIEFEVVPGITSAIGGLCYAGIPITHRDYSSSFHVITGHLKDDENDELNWNALANNEGTLVFLMGIANLKKISNNLIREGKSKETPVALISWATRYNQSVVTGSLENIYDIAIKEGVKPPTLIVVGDVVKLREKLNFFENKPLFGKNILVTRARTQSSTLVEKIMDLG